MARAAYVHFTPSSPGKPPPPALVAHLRADDDARPVEAVKRQDLPRSIDYGSEPDRAQKVVSTALRARREAKTGGRPPIQNVNLLIAGPPAWESAEAWPLEKIDRWAKANVRWLQKLLPPDTPLRVSRVHCDELSPHHHVSFPPVSPDHAGRPTLSWKRGQAYMADKAAEAPVKNSRPRPDERHPKQLPSGRRPTLRLGARQGGRQGAVRSAGSQRGSRPADRQHGRPARRRRNAPERTPNDEPHSRPRNADGPSRQRPNARPPPTRNAGAPTRPLGQ